MRYNVLEQGFPATLKTPEGEILEYGRAFISPDQQGITFKNDFVPLFKMGTPLVIVAYTRRYRNPTASPAQFIYLPKIYCRS